MTTRDEVTGGVMVASASRAWFASLGLLAALASGCLIQPVGEDDPWLELRLDLPWVEHRQQATTFNPWDGQGLFRLEAFPKLVRVAVEHDDYELTSATWPDREAGVGDGEGDDGEAGVLLQVPAGAGRRIRVLAFHVGEDGEVSLYAESAELLVDLAAGEKLDLVADVSRQATGRVEGTVRCREGNVAAWAPVDVALVDARAEVVYPSVPVSPDSTTSALIFGVPAVGLDRPHWARVGLVRASDGQRTFVDVRVPTFSVATRTEAVAVNITIPCGF